MIAWVSGHWEQLDSSRIVVKTGQGIGYIVYLHERFVHQLNVQCELYLYHVVRETSQELFGFETLRDRELFELLLKVKGVGPKSAYHLVGELGGAQLSEAIRYEQKKVLTSVAGVGPKAAGQILLDLKGKLDKLEESWRRQAPQETDSENTQERDGLEQESLQAFESLGMDLKEIYPIIRQLRQQHEFRDPASLVRAVLRQQRQAP